MVAQGEHFTYYVEHALPDPIHTAFRKALRLPINQRARLGRGKGFPYPVMFLAPCHIHSITTGSRAWLVLKEPCPESTLKCEELMRGQIGVYEFYVDAKRMIPKREYEDGLEIGGFFFDFERTKTVAYLFNDLFQ